jgi:flagellar biogenesis protein FliO
MKRIPLAILTVASAFAAAQTTVAGTKPDLIGPRPTGSSGLGIMSLVQLLLALAAVFVLVRYLLPKVASKVGKRLVTKVGSAIKVEGSASFGGGMLYVVEARGKTLLLSVGTQGVSCLADLTQPGKAQEAMPTFDELLDEQPENPIAPFTAVVEVPEESPARPSELSEMDARQALARLKRIVD